MEDFELSAALLEMTLIPSVEVDFKCSSLCPRRDHIPCSRLSGDDGCPPNTLGEETGVNKRGNESIVVVTGLLGIEPIERNSRE